jgi:hypothetical protein
MTPFYEKALTLFTQTQNKQIFKGLKKYPEPFNPHSWTSDELLDHALEEAVDLTHYIVGLKEKLDVQADYIEHLEQELRYLKSENTRLSPKKAPYDDIDDI